jgi:hypothetical protein
VPEGSHASRSPCCRRRCDGLRLRASRSGPSRLVAPRPCCGRRCRGDGCRTDGLRLRAGRSGPSRLVAPRDPKGPRPGDGAADTRTPARDSATARGRVAVHGRWHARAGRPWMRRVRGRAPLLRRDGPPRPFLRLRPATGRHARQARGTGPSAPRWPHAHPATRTRELVSGTEHRLKAPAWQPSAKPRVAPGGASAGAPHSARPRARRGRTVRASGV